ncbi:ferrochelatase [Neisseriaceae bacterium ESL0693]|nr:ferrochelatase [Neisseriaceae bacterium ESL0693]
MPDLFLPEADSSGARVGVLLLNLGTPQAPTAQAVRPYLREFLSDQRVVELPRFLWQCLLRGIILPIRGRKSAHAYQTIWQADGSPLLTGTIKLTQALSQRFSEDIITAYAMTYGQPSVRQVMQHMKQQGADRILVIPLYPQYAASSSGAALDQVWRVLLKQRAQMAVRSITTFADDAGYIHALAEHIRQYWQQHGQGQHLLISFHGIPEAQRQQGDPYVSQCQSTTRLLTEALQLSPSQYTLAFQSRFGPAKWVGPSTQDLLQQLPQQGIRTLDVVCPGFVTDCLETLEEINIRGKQDFLAHGGQQLNYIPCLNDNHEWVDALQHLVNNQLQGWTPERS